MEVKKYTEHVEYDREVTDYIAFDGKVFIDEEACLLYEKRTRKNMEIESHPVSKSIRDLSYWPLWDVFARMCYLSSDDDHKFLKDNYLADECCIDDFNVFGPGFYAFWNENNGDHPDTYYLCNIDAYIQKTESELASWKASVLRLEQDIVSKFKSFSGDVRC